MEPRKGAISCPVCQCVFVGRYRWCTGPTAPTGKQRLCPNGHMFPNPIKPKKEKSCLSCINLRSELERLTLLEADRKEWIEVATKNCEKMEELKQLIRNLYSEVNCRIEHGAESGGHLEYVQEKLKEILK